MHGVDWQIDPDGFAKAKELLGIKFPVRVRFISKENSTDTMSGKYHGLMHWGITSPERFDEPTHHISLGANLSTYSANKTLWHELTHAAQCEDFLPEEGRDGLEPYEIANKEMRLAFARDLRGLGKTYSYDAPFEKEAVYFMKNGEGLKIIVPTEETKKRVEDSFSKSKKGSTTTTHSSKKDFRKTYRVDMWKDKAEGSDYVDTCYVMAMTETDAKAWARKEHMKGMKYSSEMIATEVPGSADAIEGDPEDETYDGEDWTGWGTM